jgi:uncharacterized protein YdcH (DUF465 family)
MQQIILKMSEAQLNAIIDMADDLEAMLGCSDNSSISSDTDDFDTIQKKRLKLFDKMLKLNGYKR